MFNAPAQILNGPRKRKAPNRGNVATNKQIAEINAANKAPRAKARKATTNSTLTAAQMKEYYLLFSHLHNSNINLDTLNHMFKQARNFRLAGRPAQLSAWSGSLLENVGFKAGANKRETAYVDMKTAETDPVRIVQGITEPTFFIKTRFSIVRSPSVPANLPTLKERINQNKAAGVVNNLRSSVEDILRFTERVAASTKPGSNNNGTGNVGKVKGTTQIQPDIILSLPKANGIGGDVHIYELKIGAGKSETIPAEALQLVKMKYLMQIALRKANITGWKVHIHFLPWFFGVIPGSVIQYQNWRTPRPKGTTNFSAMATKFINSNSNYNINLATKNNLKPFLNINTVNGVLGIGRANRVGKAGVGARRVAAAGVSRALHQFSGEINNFNLNRLRGETTGTSTVRYAYDEMIYAAQRYFDKMPLQNLPRFETNDETNRFYNNLGKRTSDLRFVAHGGSMYPSNNESYSNQPVTDRPARFERLKRAVKSFEKTAYLASVGQYRRYELLKKYINNRNRGPLTKKPKIISSSANWTKTYSDFLKTHATNINLVEKMARYPVPPDRPNLMNLKKVMNNRAKRQQPSA